MKIYAKYIFLKLLKNFSLISAVVLVIISLFQLLKFIYLISKGALLFDVIDLVVLSIPSMLYVVLPLSTLQSAAYTYNSLVKSQEITILRGAALSNFQIARPAIVFSIIVTILTYCITIYFAPSFYTQLKNKVFELRNNYTIEAIEENSFNRLNKYTTIYLGSRISGNAFKNILIFDETGKSKIFIAKVGEIKFADSVVELRLKNGTVQELDQNNYLNSLNFDDFDLKVNLYTSYKRYAKDINEYSMSELFASKKPKFIAEASQRLLWPSYNFLLVLFSLGMFLHKPKNTFTDKIKIVLQNLLIIAIYFISTTIAMKDAAAIWLPYLWSLIVFFYSVKLYRQRI
jgi:lipopolysaccharide export system permease protein